MAQTTGTTNRRRTTGQQDRRDDPDERAPTQRPRSRAGEPGEKDTPPDRHAAGQWPDAERADRQDARRDRLHDDQPSATGDRDDEEHEEASRRGREHGRRQRRRADAERSIAAILDAALGCFTERPDASMTDIARAAGVGRVTLYAHFPSRAAVLDAALDRAFVEANAVLDSQVDDSQPADQTLRALIRSSWQLLDRYRRLLQAAQRDLDAEDLRRHHDTALARVEKLLTRGQAEGTFRTDLPLGWLVTTFYSLVHAAADDVNAGRLDPADAAPVLEATLLSALRPSSDPR